MGAGETVDSLPIATLYQLFPEAFPLDPDFRSILLSAEEVHDKGTLLRLIFALAALPQNMDEDEEFAEAWEKDQFFRILVDLNRKSCKLYMHKNRYALHKRAEYERRTKDNETTLNVKQQWSLPVGFNAKQALISTTVEELLVLFPSGHSLKGSSALLRSPHLSRRAAELDTLLQAMVTILVYPPAENYWPLVPEHRNKIEPLIPKVVDNLEELSKQFRSNG